uniref:Uncharacterized LOC100178907 n=1 Tax=Ciona intestinalis TaxID=7719 RepID=F6PME6_CIOIN|nr:uncharacterized protein LOC100178907 [Ciona intestinalis]|eukprot:XP_002129727.1 uncharacterized protein LOC100178907 [Ciona intestinalis]
MKGLTIFVCIYLLLNMTSASPVSELNEQTVKKVTYSEEAKDQIREASVIAVSYLCLGENVIPEIQNTICANALYSGMGVRSTSYAASDCMDCSVAEPVCWDSCPRLI